MNITVSIVVNGIEIYSLSAERRQAVDGSDPHEIYVTDTGRRIVYRQKDGGIQLARQILLSAEADEIARIGKGEHNVKTQNRIKATARSAGLSK